MTKHDIITSETTQTAIIEQVPLSQLELSPMNPRQDVTEGEIAALAQSIRTVGLMQNLIGLRLETDRIAIVAGGRRLRALRVLASEEEQDAASVFIPVRITEDAPQAQLWASTENTARTALNPAGEIHAYGRMVEAGADVDTIAKAFAVTARHVKGRLRLAGLAPVILEALRTGGITLDVAAAYTVTQDVATQEATFARLHNSYGGDSPHQIKRALMQEAIPAESALARCVGRDAYEAAGGAIREDLFGDNIWFCDADVLRELAEAKLAKTKSDLEAEGWAWVQAQIEPIGYDTLASFARTYPEQATLSEEEEVRYNELADLIEADACDAEDVAAFEELEAHLNEEHYSATQKAHAGVMITLGWDGTIDLRQGLIRPEDQADAIEAGLIEPSRHKANDKPVTPYPAAVMRDLTAIRTGAIQTALLKKPELALDLLIFALSTPCFTGVMPLGVQGTDAQNTPDKPDEGLDLPETLTPKPYRAPLTAKEANKAFAAFRKHSRKVRNAILTEHVARLFHASLALEDANPLVEQIATLTETDARSVWTPTKDFFARLKSTQLDAVMAEIIGHDVSPAFAKSAKKEKVDKLHALFTEDAARAGLSKDAKERLATWLPEGLGDCTEVEVC